MTLSRSRSRHPRAAAWVALVTALASSACFVRGGGGLFFALADTALLTAVIVSATRPPPPRVVYVPEERPGYAWQPGYWTLDAGQWVWVDGGWVVLQPGYAWAPAHWEEMPDGNWQLIAGHWVPAGAPGVVAAPPPPPAPAPAAPTPAPAPAPAAPAVRAGGPEYIPAPQ
jgi:hypothetical protein